MGCKSDRLSLTGSVGLLTGGGCTVAMRGGCAGQEPAPATRRSPPDAPSSSSSPGDSPDTDPAAAVRLHKVLKVLRCYRMTGIWYDNIGLVT